MKTRHNPFNYNFGKRSGFALIVALSLMAFILLLLVGLTTIVRVETRASALSQSKLKAEQNALLSLQIALGELQRSMGPDQRVSATAKILTTTDSAIPRGKGHVLGAWSSAPSTGASDDPLYDNGDLVAWLVSDARDASGAPIETYNTTAAPTVGTQNSTVLVGAGSLPSTNGVVNDDRKQIVVDTSNTTLSKGDSIVGHYGWWIGDENLKARINLDPIDASASHIQQQKLRAIHELSSAAIASPSALPGLKTIDFLADAERLVNLSSIELLAGSSANISKHFFHSLTTHAHGVLADVRFGGLKKDLSLAFEMQDTNFNQSEFAGNGFDPFIPWLGAPFNVQPIFTFDNSTFSGGDNFSGTANGPAWHLLRDYYRIYHRIKTPMTDPTLQAQVFGPNLNHDRYPDPNSASHEGDGQPAWLMTGGRAFRLGKFTNAPDAIANNLLTWVQPYKSDPNPMTVDERGDPLRARPIAANNWNLPTMVSSNYLPLVTRIVHEWGIHFAAPKHPPQDENVYKRATVGVRNVFVIHNPYNVRLEHNDLSIELEGWGALFNIYDSDSNLALTYWKQEPPKNAEKNSERILSKAVIASGNMAPGSMQAFRGRRAKAEIGHEPPLESNGFGGSIWESPVHGADGEIGNMREGTYTVVAKPGHYSGRHPIGSVKSSLNGGNCENWYAPTRVGAALFMDNGAGFNNDESFKDRWPLAYSFGSTVTGPGPEYDLAIADNKALSSTFRYAIDNDSTYPNSVVKTVTSLFNYTDPQDPLRLLTYDLQLKPTEYQSASGLEARYPVYALTNPLAPVKDNRNIFPANEFADSANVDGYPTFSPGWDFNVTNVPNGTAIDYRFWGASDGSISNSSGGAVDNAVILELPTSPVLSIGKLQHANITVYDHMPALAIGNAFASPLIDRTQVYTVNGNRYGQDRVFYDISYLMNDVLWDSYFFSSYSIPYDADSDDYDEIDRHVQESFESAFNSSSPEPLPNARMRLHLAESETIDEVRSKLFENQDPKFDSSRPDENGDHGYRRSAENLLVNGAFNVNSTDVDAWVAVLSGARNREVYINNPSDPTAPKTPSMDSTPFLRISQPIRGGVESADLTDSNPDAWGGFRTLSDVQIRALAENIVQEIRNRANDPAQASPFLSMANFVNRKLSADHFGLAGVLQAAIDATVEIRTTLEDGYSEFGNDVLTDPANNGFEFPHAENLFDAGGNAPAAAMSAPTYLLQSDILQALGSFLTVRGDCFKIRAYGDSRNPLNGETLAKAWCEAIVQRVPEPVHPRADSSREDPEYWSGKDLNGTPSPFGRKFIVISFNWLNEDEV